MRTPQHEAEALQRSAHADAVDELQESVRGVVLRTLTGKFGLPEEEAEALLRMLLLSSIATPVPDPRAWLIVSACHAARAWQRARLLSDTPPALPPDATSEEIAAMRGIVMDPAVLATLPERGRDALRLRFSEQRTFDEIAAELSIAPAYARALVLKGMARLATSRKGEEEPQ